MSSPARVSTPSSPRRSGSSTRSTPTSHSGAAGQVSYDWPLSREEKKACIMRFYDNEIKASQAMLKSTPSAVQSVRDEVSRVVSENGAAERVQATSSDTETTPVKRLLMTPERSEAIDDGEEAASEISAVDSVMNNLSRLSNTSGASTRDSDAARSSVNVDPELLQETLTALSKLLAASQVAKIATKEEQDELYGANPANRTSKSVPERSLEKAPSALRRKHRRSRGPDEHVRFAVTAEGSDEEKPGDAIDVEKQAHERGRSMRRVSRGPDGRTYSVPEDKQPDSSSSSSGGKVATVAASAVAGGSGGFLTGGAVGAVLGVPAALFTFGLSIPIGAALGSGAGLCAGSALGGSAGYLYSNRQGQSQAQEDAGSDDA